jgi:hypothetical protein
MCDPQSDGQTYMAKTTGAFLSMSMRSLQKLNLGTLTNFQVYAIINRVVLQICASISVKTVASVLKADLLYTRRIFGAYYQISRRQFSLQL